MVLKYLNPFIKRVGTSKKNIQQMAILKDPQKSPNSFSKHAVGYFCFTGSLLEHDFSWHKAKSYRSPAGSCQQSPVNVTVLHENIMPLRLRA